MPWSSAVVTVLAFIKTTCDAWREQHSLDVDLYQSSHTEWKNQWLHQCLIPLESFSVVLIIAGVLRRWFQWSALPLHVVLVGMVGFGMGLMSLAIADPERHPWAGIASFLFWVAAPWASCTIVARPSPPSPSFNNHFAKSWNNDIVLLAFVMWILASSLQVVLGHWLWEKNSPDVLNNAHSDQISWLSLSHSVQIAWSQHNVRPNA